MIDLHIHTTYSDGRNSVEEMVKKAVSLGFKKIAITDHVWKTSNWFDEYYEYIKAIDLNGIEVLAGFEAKALNVNGEIDAPKSAISKADIRIGAIHRIPKSEKCGKFLTTEEVDRDEQLAYQNWFKTTIGLIQNKSVDVVAHPFMVLFKYGIKPREKEINSIMESIMKHKKKIELTGRYKNANKPLIEYITEHPSAINFLTYGSDAHGVDDLMLFHE